MKNIINLNMEFLNDSWTNKKTLQFISSLSFDGYMLAGHSVTNMVNQTKNKGDLDFWVTDSSKYSKTFDEMYNYYNNFNIYPSMIEMYNDENSDSEDSLPKINLVHSSSNPCETINRFDFDYCRCYWTPNTGVVFGFGCKESIQSKLIKYPTCYVNKRRIIKAINYGYTLTRSFWFERSYLIVGKKSNVRLTQGKLLEPYEVKINELDENKFGTLTDPIYLSDYTNVEQSINEICSHFEYKNKITDVLIPVLVHISNSSINSNVEFNKKLVHEYIDQIILSNPLTNSNYLEFQIGKHFINLKNKTIHPVEMEHVYISDSELESVEENDVGTYETGPTKIIVSNQSDNCEIIKLNESGTAFIMINYLPNSIKEYLLDNFDTMWALHPKTKHKIIMYEEEIEVFRYSKSYLKTPTDLEITKTHSYMYSGFDTSDNNSDLPEQFVQVYNYMLNQDSKYNQVIANWYEDSNDYIAPHADCTKCMIPDAKISIVSIYPTEDPSSYRYLTVVPKYGKYSEKSIKKIRLDHGSIVTMCGTTQKEFLHSVDKSDVPISRRISLSFRQMI